MALIEVDISVSVDGYVTGPEPGVHGGLGKGARSCTHGSVMTWAGGLSAISSPQPVYVMGGASIVQQALRTGLVDQLHLHVAPVLLGGGTPLFDHLASPLGLERLGTRDTPGATHLTYRVVR